MGNDNETEINPKKQENKKNQKNKKTRKTKKNKFFII